MPEFSVGRWTFPSKKSLIEKLRMLLYGTPVGDRITGEDEELLKALVHRHPSSKELIGCGMEGIVIGRSSYGSPQYRVLRTNGVTEAFSYKKTITHSPVSEHRWKVRQAFREAVHHEVTAVKWAAEGKRCSYSGEIMTGGRIDVDHVGEGFAKIMDRFLEARCLTIPEVEYVETGVGDTYEIADRELMIAWVKFHKENALLVPVFRGAHRKRHYPGAQPLDETLLPGSKRVTGGSRSS